MKPRKIAPKEEVGRRENATGYYALEITGKEQGLWRRLRTRFVMRLKNKMKGFFSRHSPRGITVHEEANEAMTSAVNSLQAMLAKAAVEQSKNAVEIEKSKAEIAKIHAEIERTRSESQFNNAKTREAEASAALLELQARKLHHEVQVQQVRTSVTILEAMIAKGQLHIREDEQGVYILVRDAPLLNAPTTKVSPLPTDEGCTEDG